MIITIDATGLGKAKTGTAVYLLEILRVWNQDKRLPHTFTIFTSPKAKSHFDGLCLDRRFQFVFAPNSRVLRILWQQTVLPAKIWLIDSDVHWGSAFVLPLLSRRRMVVSVHDITFQLFPEVHQRVKRWYFPWMIGRAVNKADSVIAISETTRNDLAALYPAASPRIRVTPLGWRSFNETSSTEDDHPSSSGPYILFIGTLEPRKNLARLIRAWRSVPADVRGQARLFISGAEGWMMNEMLASHNEDDKGIEFLGFVDDSRLGSLLKNAMALAYPSLYEGFGLPVLEAMAMGVPVLTSGTGATAEIAGGAALLVDPCSEQAIADGLRRLIEDAALRTDLKLRGLARAKAFSWKTTADETLAVLQDIGGAGATKDAVPTGRLL